MRCALAFLTALAPALTVAQQPEPSDVETFVPMTPLVRANPDYPPQAERFRNEGWVMLSYVVSEAGEVEDAMIEDSSGVEAFERAALDAVSRWRYTPATVNGQPVAQSMVNTKITFAIQGKQATGATREFQDSYRKIRGLLDARDFAAAEPLITEMEFGGRQNLYEDALFWALKYGYLEGVQSTDTAAKQRALQLALGYQSDHLPPDMLVALMQRLYVLQVQAIDFGAARSTFERLQSSESAKKSTQHAQALAELEPSYGQLEQVIAGPRVLAMKGEIDQYDYWVHQLMRRSFSMADVNGRIDSVGIRCERGTRRYDDYPGGGDVWQVPESWGECGVYVRGEPKTTFTFEEHPAGTPGTPLARE